MNVVRIRLWEKKHFLIQEKLELQKATTLWIKYLKLPKPSNSWKIRNEIKQKLETKSETRAEDGDRFESEMLIEWRVRRREKKEAQPT